MEKVSVSVMSIFPAVYDMIPITSHLVFGLLKYSFPSEECTSERNVKGEESEDLEWEVL